MIQNSSRNGAFTSSGIVALLSTGKQQNGFGTGAITYILETNMERMAGRSIDIETDSRPTSWGNLLEPHVHQMLTTSYIYSSNITDVHPDIPYWVGTKDGLNTRGEKAVTDIKCPFTLKSFIQLILPLYCGLAGIEAMNAIRNGFRYLGFDYPAHKSGETYYQQLVSNSCINNTTHAELIIYCPYQSELLKIKALAEDNPSVKWLDYIDIETGIPYLPDGGKFKNLNIIRFEVPQADKDLLTNVVKKAGSMLISEEHTQAA